MALRRLWEKQVHEVAMGNAIPIGGDFLALSPISVTCHLQSGNRALPTQNSTLVSGLESWVSEPVNG